MRLLLDTHVLIWAAGCTERLSPTAHSRIADPDTENFVSVASLWEIFIKVKSGKIVLPGDIRTILLLNRFTLLGITIDHAELAAGLPILHKDPFDRMLVAQALAENLTLVTNDAQIGQYNVNILAAS